MKKILLSVALTAAATTVHAEEEKPFDGFHAGIEAGYWNGKDVKAGLYYGGLLGFRKQLDNDLVIGVEGTFGDNTSSLTDGDFKSSTDYEWTAQAIIGKALGAKKNNLIFIGGGLAGTRASGKSPDTSFSANATGYSVTAGYEHAFENNMSLRVVGRTYEFNSIIATVGLAYRF